MNIILIWFAIKYNGDWDKIYKALEDKEKVSLDQIRALEEEVKAKKWNIITILDMNYPNKLKEAYKPPFVLWANNESLSKDLREMKFIGASVDQLDKTTKERLDNFVPEIEKNYNLVTSSLITNDKEILGHSTKPVLHILPHGMDKIGKLNIKDGDLVMTEYPEGTASSKDRKRNTNRLTAAFAETLILFSSKKDGDVNNLITNMLNLGKEIYCFPGNGKENDGNSELIKQGANLITSIKDIK